MLTLAIESSAKAASVALLRDDILLAQSYQNSGLTHSATLLPMAEDLLKNCGVAKSELELVAVAQGPGSFTGLRIGLSLAKGLAWALDIPTCGVSTLEAMAWQGITAPEGAVVCCCMDARRNQVYNALFAIEKGAPTRLCEDRGIAIEDLKTELSGALTYLIGDGAKLAHAAIPGSVLAPEPMQIQSAWGVGMASLNAERQSSHELLPTYLRGADNR